MAELTEDQKRQIVVGFAHFKSPAEIRALMREEHGLELEFRQITTYDPQRANFEASDKWREIFDIHRNAYLEDVKAIPISSQAYRLNVLQEELTKARKMNNAILAAQLLEQAAKEMGGLLTNARSLDVNDKRRGELFELTPEERREKAKELLREVFAKNAPEAMNGGPVIEHQPAEGTEGSSA